MKRVNVIYGVRRPGSVRNLVLPLVDTQGHSECDDVCDARLLDCDARNVLCDVAVFDCFVTEENVIWSKQLE